MIIKRIKLCQFRNYTDWEYTFPITGAVIYGTNGCGKTNLFEAISYCSLGKSVKFHNDSLLIQFDKRFFQINAEFNLKMGEYCFSAHHEISQKRFTLNSLPVKQLSQLYNYIKVVYCSPEDIAIINGSPKLRRRYFDLAIAQLNPSYIYILKNYVHVVEQRNNLLKDESSRQQKTHWDELFIETAIPVIKARIDYLLVLQKKLKNEYGEIIYEARKLTIDYKSSMNYSFESSKASLMKVIKNIESKEIMYQRSLIGPHLDEYLICLEGHILSSVGSQGQKRTVSLLLKIAQLQLIKESINEYPILLLDDIFADLDYDHTMQFMKLLIDHEQIFIATPNQTTANLWKDLPQINLNEVNSK